MSDSIYIDGVRLLPIAEAAALSGRSRREIEERTARGQLRFLRAGKRLYVAIDPLMASFVRVELVPDTLDTEDWGVEGGSRKQEDGRWEMEDGEGSREHIPKHIPEFVPETRETKPSTSIPRLLSITIGIAFVIYVSALGVYTFGPPAKLAFSAQSAAGAASGFLSSVGEALSHLFGGGAPSEERFGISYKRAASSLAAVGEALPSSSGTTATSPGGTEPSAAAGGGKQKNTQAPQVIRETIVERQVPVPVPAYDPSIAARFEELDKRLSSQIYALSQQNSKQDTTITEHYNAVGGALRIDELSKIALKDSTITNASITASSLTVNGSASSTFANGLNLTAGCVTVNGTCLGTGSGTVGSGTTGQFPYYAANGTTLSATSSIYLAITGNVGVGTTSPFRRFSVTDGGSSAPQLALGFNAANGAQVMVDSTGALSIAASGNQVRLNNDNFWVCTGGSATTNGCPTGNPSGQGNLVIENRLGIGTSTLGVSGANYAFTLDLQNDSTTNLLSISTSTSGYGTTRSIFTIDSGGKVGIATSSPWARLTVGAGGAITTTENSLTDGATITVNWREGNQQYVTLGGNRTINFSNYVGGQILRLFVCQDATGSRTVTWDSNISWQGGSAPTLTTTASQCDLLTFAASKAKGTLKVYGAAATNF